MVLVFASLLDNFHRHFEADICNPCGEKCKNCDNWKCALGCVDNNFAKRVYDPDNGDFNGTEKIYTRRLSVERASKNQKVYDKFVGHEMSKNVDFNSCHSVWRTRSIDLKPVSLDKAKLLHGI